MILKFLKIPVSFSKLDCHLKLPSAFILGTWKFSVGLEPKYHTYDINFLWSLLSTCTYLPGQHHLIGPQGMRPGLGWRDHSKKRLWLFIESIQTPYIFIRNRNNRPFQYQYSVVARIPWRRQQDIQRIQDYCLRPIVQLGFRTSWMTKGLFRETQISLNAWGSASPRQLLKGTLALWSMHLNLTNQSHRSLRANPTPLFTAEPFAH